MAGKETRPIKPITMKKLFSYLDVSKDQKKAIEDSFAPSKHGAPVFVKINLGHFGHFRRFACCNPEPSAIGLSRSIAVGSRPSHRGPRRWSLDILAAPL